MNRERKRDRGFHLDLVHFSSLKIYTKPSVRETIMFKNIEYLKQISHIFLRRIEVKTETEKNNLFLKGYLFILRNRVCVCEGEERQGENLHYHRRAPCGAQTHKP